MCTFTDPKQLPCFHSYCVQCLNDIQRSSGVQGKITCPECRKQFQIPGSGNPSELPTNFRIKNCKNCQVAICNTCAVTLHERHSKMLLQEATDAHKSHINSLIESLKEKHSKNARMSNNAAKIASNCKCKWPR